LQANLSFGTFRHRDRIDAAGHFTANVRRHRHPSQFGSLSYKKLSGAWPAVNVQPVHAVRRHSGWQIAFDISGSQRGRFVPGLSEVGVNLTRVQAN